MNNLCEFTVTAPAEIVVKKLAKANIAAYNVKIKGNALSFQVRDEYIKKVFAIFAHPCYNVRIRRKSPKNRLMCFALNRIGLFIGGALFLAAVILSNSFIFKISVTGSGSYLKSEVLGILRDSGLNIGSYYKRLDKPVAQARIMALPEVTFCSIERAGSALIVDVQTDGENSAAADYKPLVCDADGKLLNIVAICGTAEAEAGSTVKKGDTLIGAYSLAADGSICKGLAVGYAEIECNGIICVTAPCDSVEYRQNALDSTLIYAENVTGKSCTVKQNGDTVVYEVTFTYIHTLSINME